MKSYVKTLGIALSALLVLSGCSMWDAEDNAASKSAQTSNTTPPESAPSAANSDSMDAMMNYLKQKGVEISNLAPIDQMDFAAHEGKSFTYQGSTAYLYRLKSDDANMKALLHDAKEKGSIKVKQGGEEKLYNAFVNGDYLFVYEKDAEMGDFVSVLGSYVPGATTTTPNLGGAPTQTPETTSGSETTESGQAPQTNANE